MKDRYDEDRYRDDRYRDTRWRGRDARGMIERGTDEVRSWFGDEEAERRRRVLDRDREDWSDRSRRNPDWDERESRRRNSPAQGWTHLDWQAQSWRDRGWSDRDRPDWDEDRAWTPQREYGYSSLYSSPRHDDYSRDWRYGDRGRERGWRGEYLSSYASPDAPTRMGGYAGRGPKGYQRADARIQEDVSDRLGGRAGRPDSAATSPRALTAAMHPICSAWGSRRCSPTK